MAAKMVPLEVVQYPRERTFPMDMFGIFYPAGLADDDESASVVRIRVYHESARDEMRQAIRRKLAKRPAARLIRFMDERDWDAAFLIDGG
jgi:hypothetical protein